MLRRHVVVVLAVPLGLTAVPLARVRADEGATSQVIERAAEVSRLEPSEAEAGHPVRLAGTVVYSDPQWSVLFVTDPSGTAFVDHTALDSVPSRGTEVEIDGRTAAMGRVPGVAPDRLTERRRGKELPANTANLRSLARRPTAFEWVEIGGVVRTLVEARDHTLLDVQVGGRRLEAIVPQEADAGPGSLVDAEVALTGVLEWEGKSPHPPRLWVPSWEQTRVTAPAARPDEMPILPVSAARGLAEGRLPDHRIRVRGFMVERQSQQDYTIEDETGRIDARGLASAGLAQGVGLDLAGFLEIGPRGPRLVDVVETVFEDPHIFRIPETLEGDAPTLRKLAEVRALPAEEARRGLPVEVTGVVTIFDPTGDLLFVQDETAAVYVNAIGANLSLRSGQRVRLTGRTAPGSLAPVIVEPRVRVLPGGGLPPPRIVSGSRFATGQDDCHLVEVAGRVRRASPQARTGDLEIESEGRRFLARITRRVERAEIEPLVGAQVRLRGVCATMYDWRLRFTGVELLVPDLGEVRIDRSPPSDVPLRAIHDVLRPVPGQPFPPQVRVRAEVLFQSVRFGTFLRDGTGVLRVDAVDKVPLHPGDRIEALGFAESGRHIPRLADSEVRIVGRGPEPAPTVVPADRIVGDALSGELVQLSATLYDAVQTSSELTFLLDARNSVVEAILAGPVAEDAADLGRLRPGSQLEITGIAMADESRLRGSSPLVLLRSAADIRVLARPSWWTAGRVSIVAALLLAAAALAFVWGWTLRRRVRHQTGVIRANLEQVRESEERYRTLFETQQKLVADLEAKNTELERFTYTVSHDLKAPLVTIQGFLGFLEKDAHAGDLDRISTDIERVSTATEKMQLVLKDLLDLSRVGRLMNPPESVPFADILADSAKAIEGQLEASGTRLEVSSELPVVHVDRIRITEVLQNLLDNAVKFMDAQRSPTIEVGCRGEDVDGNLVLFVRDNGVGIDPRFHEQIFGLFNKLDAESDGTGVGLALARRIVEVHGGRIWVESEGAGQGTAVVFTLPGNREPESEAPSPG